MRNLKKFLALVLAMVMAFSLMLTVNAATTGTQYSDASGVTPAFEEAVDVLTGMKVFQGDAEAPTFRPASSITRAEVAAIIYRLVTGDVTDSQAHLYTTQHPYTDVRSDAWYAGYVGYLHNAKIIKGTTATTFNPSDNVTGYEALAMILRAVGYDKNNEFTGSTWRVEVASTSKTLGILKDVDTTIYGGTLHLAARRDVVASLLFNTAAYVPMVQYTLAFGYQDTGMEGGVVGSTKNPTLGYKIFGLTSNTGVVVGNEVTGEAKGTTKIGFSLASARTASDILGSWKGDQDDATVVWGNINTNQTAFATAIDDSMTLNLRAASADGTIPANYTSAYNYESDTTNILPGNVTRSFKFSTDLRMFNHAVKVWYDNRSSQYETVGNGTNGTARFTTNLTTYAYFDKVVATAVVTTEDFTSNNSAPADANLDGKLGTLVGGRTNSVANNWNAPAFSMRKAGGNNVAYFNYSFGRMANANYGTDAANAPAAMAASPVLMNGESDDHGLYLLISNTEGKVLDVVIPLEMTMTQIVQNNSTTGTYTVGVTNYNDNNAYFDTYDVPGSGTQTYTNIAQDNLKNDLGKDVVTTLGTKVAAIAITGTAGGNVPTGNAGTVDFGYATQLLGGTSSSYYYQLTENTLKRTATVVAIDTANQNVTLSDGTVLHQSVFAEATDATFIPAGADTLKNIEGVDKDTTPWTMVLTAGKEYTFTLDEQGNYIYWETPAATAKFVYGTYLDFTTKVASSSFDYPLVYVGTDGQRGQDNILRVKDAFVDTGLAGGASMSAQTYNDITLNKRDQDSNSGNNSGYTRGNYIGYALSANGGLTAVGPYVAASGNDQETGFWQGAATDFGAADITISKTDATIGAKQIASTLSGAGVDLFLTENTQFYLVDGAGTDNQKVTPYKGLKAIMEGNNTVTIESNTAMGAGDFLKANPNPYTMIYYSFGRFDYAQNYVGSAFEVKTVFIPLDIVDFDKSIDSSLAFMGNKSATLISSWGEHCTQFTFYKDGVGSSYWIEGYTYEANTAAKAIDDAGDNVFYNLIPTSKKAADGQTIWTIRNVPSSAKIIGERYTGYDAATGNHDGTSTAWSTVTAVAQYAATTYSQQVAFIDDATGYAGTTDLYNVGGATVKNLSIDTVYPGINDTLASLNNAGSLDDNTRVQVSCVLSADNVVSMIYINYRTTLAP